MSTPAPWVFALALSGVVTLVVTPVAARRRRGRTGHRSRSRSRGSSSAGIALAILVTAPFLFFGSDAPLAVGVLAGLALWLFGRATAQRGRTSERTRDMALLLASVGVVAAGLRISVTGYAVGDGVVTVAVVFLAAGAWRSARTRDGLLLGWAITVAATAGWLGGLGGQRAAAAIAAAVVGSCLAFLAYWMPPTAARASAWAEAC